MMYPCKPLAPKTFLGIGYYILVQCESVKPLLKYFEGKGSSTSVFPIDTLMHIDKHPLSLLGCQVYEE